MDEKSMKIYIPVQGQRQSYNDQTSLKIIELLVRMLEIIAFIKGRLNLELEKMKD